MALGEQFIGQLLQTSALEFIAVITGILSVWFSKKEKILVYPVGMISVGIYVYLTYQYKLYADCGINVYYFLMSIYGWFHWKQKREPGRDQISISSSSSRGHFINFFTFLITFGGLYLLLSKYTDSDVPVIDALTSSLAITGMYLMALKKIEHWYFWIACDLISIPLYIYKDLPFTGLQFVVFTYLAVTGLISWKTKLAAS